MKDSLTKRQYLNLCLRQKRCWLESVVNAYDNGDTAGMRPIHRALLAIAIKRKI